jgi:hypothetical protein
MSFDTWMRFKYLMCSQEDRFLNLIMYNMI